MQLTFLKSEIVALVEQTRKAKKHRVPYTGVGGLGKLDTRPGLELVGDEGVYFMSNRVVTKVPKSGNPVSYAEQINPKVVTDWYAAKRHAFGDDDGAEFFPLADIEKWIASCRGKRLVMSLTPAKMVLLP